MLADTPSGIDYRAFPVLYVDDEAENLRTFELAFRRDFSVIKATSGSEALAALATQRVAVVLSDHRMPEMTGTELLARVREVAPRTVRLLVTAYGDASTLAQAINEGCIYRYIAKPWDIGEMREIVRQAIELYALEEHRQRLVTELQALHEASRRISGHLEVDAIADVAVRTVVDDFGFDGATLLLGETNESALRPRASSPGLGLSDPELRSLDLSSDELLAPLLEGETVLLDGSHALTAGRSVRSFAAAVAAEEMLFVPLKGHAELVGSLVVDNRRGGRRFGLVEKQLLEGFGAQAAKAIENARLVGQLRNEAARTSGSDSLAIHGALGESVKRELEDPLVQLAAAAASSATRRSLGEVARRAGVFAEVLREQAPEICDLAERGRLAKGVVGELASTLSVEITVEEGDYPKISMLPGRLLQLLVHLLELAVEAAYGGAVVISPPAALGLTLLEIKVAPSDKPQNDGSAPECEAELRLAACEGLARELALGAEISLEKRPMTWRLLRAS